MISIIDTFPIFKECFEDNLNLSIEEKINLWDREYISKFPELEIKCKEDYEENGYEWQDIAKDIVFINTKKDYNKMKLAHKNILEIIHVMNKRLIDMFSINIDINIVIYCGLCNSAGWVDKYEGKRAILYGIDKIAELGWHEKEKLEPLIAHELCHVIHFQLRGEDNLPREVVKNNYNIGVWNIYEEGFAQFYQNKLLGCNVDSRGEKWLKECKQKKKDLKEIYYDLIFNAKSTEEFYGDWYKVLGISDAGYFLGAELINKLHDKYSVEDLARLEFDVIEREVLRFLRDN